MKKTNQRKSPQQKRKSEQQHKLFSDIYGVFKCQSFSPNQ